MHMTRKLIALVLVGGVALALAAGALARRDAAPKLNGTVGPGFTIHLTRAGKAVKSLKAGTYSFVIADKASIHNFVLEKVKGGKFEKDLTDVSFKGTKTVRIKLTAGRYKFYCAPHESAMFGFFTVK
jgi:plastocyanin